LEEGREKNLQNWQGTTTMMPGKFVLFAFKIKKIVKSQKRKKKRRDVP
jgi:hypothetical protein